MGRLSLVILHELLTYSRRCVKCTVALRLDGAADALFGNLVDTARKKGTVPKKGVSHRFPGTPLHPGFPVRNTPGFAPPRGPLGPNTIARAGTTTRQTAKCPTAKADSPRETLQRLGINGCEADSPCAFCPHPPQSSPVR